MQKIIFSLFVLVFMAGNYCQAQTAESKVICMVGNKDCETVLQEVVPDEFRHYKDLSAKGYDLKTAQSALALVSKTLTVWSEHKDDKNMPEEKRFHMHRSQMFAWEIVIQTWKKTTDETAKAEILSVWNSSLKDKPYDVEFLICALEYEWDRAFMTDPFVKLFKQTKDSTLINKFCQVFGQYGEYAEERLLNEKLDFVMNALTPGTPVYDVALSNIESALKQIDYWKKGDPYRVGPASLDTESPRPNY